jgi:NADH dehydrogenase
MRLVTASRCDNVLVLGGTGFIGRSLVARLVAQGRSVTLPTRRETHARPLILLPGVNALVANVHDEATLARLVAGSDAVINLVGVLHSRRGNPYGPEFARAHVELPRKLVAACHAAGVKRYLHMSALGASADGPSMYLRSKADGELAALSDPMLRTTIFRPSVVFGEEDNFLNMFARMQRIFPLIPLGGADAKFQPVYVEDVVGAFVDALEDHDSYGRTIELVGPRVYSLRQLVRLAGEYSGCPRPVIGLPDWLARMQAWFLEHAPGGPIMSRDNLDSMRRDNIASPNTVSMPTAIEDVAPYYLGPQVSPTGYEHTRHHA